MEVYHAPQVSIILPVYNETAALPLVIKSIRHALRSASFDYQILVVNDGSRDDSVKIARGLGVEVLDLKDNRGAGRARREGIKAAKGDIIVFLDADGTYQPEDIPQLVEECRIHDQVVGMRNTESASLKYLRLTVKLFFRLLASVLACHYIGDLNSGLRAMKKKTIMRYVHLVPDGFSCVTTMTMCFLLRGHSVHEIPTTYHPRIGGSKFHPIIDTAKLGFAIFRATFFLRKDRLALFGLALLGVGFSLWHWSDPLKASILAFASIAGYFGLACISNYFISNARPTSAGPLS